MKTKLTWTPAKVGCYWHAAGFTIGTQVLYRNGKAVLTFPDSAYVLTRNFEELGRFKTLKSAQRAAAVMA